MRELIQDPDEFFAEVTRFGRLSRSSGVVLLAGIAYALPIATLFLTLTTPQRTNIPSAFYGLMLVKFLSPLFLWLLFSLGFGVIGRVFGGQPNYGRLFRTVGWGFVPYIVTGIVWALGRYVALRGAPPPEEVTTQGFEFELPALQGYLAQAEGDPVFIVARFIGVVFILFGAYLMSYAVKHAIEVDLREAAITVAIPVAIYLGVEFGLIGIV